MRPRFIRVLPDEVEKYGSHAAVLLAHIRFRCESDGPGRITAGGVRWWRVSQVDIADETGLSVQGVKTALKALENVVVAKHFPPLSNQSRAYRVTTHQNGAELPEFDFNQWNDLPEFEINRSEFEINDCSIGSQPLQNLKSTSVPITGEAGAGGEARARERELALDPSPGDPPPKNCSQHPDGTTESCGPCGASRRAYEVWVKRAWLWLGEAERIADNTRDRQAATEIGHDRKRLLAVLKSLGETRK